MAAAHRLLHELHVLKTAHARPSRSFGQPAPHRAGGRPQIDARRQMVLERLRREHPDWSEQQILFGALCEMNHGGDAQFMRKAAAHIAEWSQAQSTAGGMRTLPPVQ